MKKNIIMSIIIMIAMLCSGCAGEEFSIQIHEDGTCDVCVSIMYEQSVYDSLIYDGQLTDLDLSGLGYTKSQKIYNSNTYVSFDKTVKCSSILEMTNILENEKSFQALFGDSENANAYSEDDSEETGIHIVKAGLSSFQGVVKACMTKEELDMYQSEYGESYSDMFLVRFSIGFDKEITCTNGQLSSDKKQATWIISDFMNDTLMEASVSGEDAFLSDTFVPYSTTLTNGEYYNISDLQLGIQDNIGVASVLLNGKAVSASDYVEETGKYIVNASDFAGNTKEITFYVDLENPTIQLKKTGKKYKIVYSDNMAIKTAVLNGKNFTSGKVVSKKGTYKIKVTDKAGNVTSKTLKIK